jgi:hypothetical protein
MNRRCLVAVLLVEFTFCALPSFAQTNTAVIKGLVRDNVGNPIPDAQISLVNVSVGDSAAPVIALTDRKGEYRFPELSPAAYTITAELAGFQTARYSKIALSEKESSALDFTLIHGAVSSPIELRRDAPRKPEGRPAPPVLPSLPPLPRAQVSPGYLVRHHLQEIG